MRGTNVIDRIFPLEVPLTLVLNKYVSPRLVQKSLGYENSYVV